MNTLDPDSIYPIPDWTEEPMIERVTGYGTYPWLAIEHAIGKLDRFFAAMRAYRLSPVVLVVSLEYDADYFCFVCSMRVATYLLPLADYPC